MFMSTEILLPKLGFSMDVLAASYLVERKAHYHFTVKANQPNLLDDIELHFRDRGTPDFVESTELDHGRISHRSIWTPTALKD